MKRKTNILIIGIILILSVMCICPKSVYATKSMDDIISSWHKFISDGTTTKSTLDGESMKTFSSSIYNILFAVAVVIAVIVAAILGIQFVFGSVEAQVKVKEALVPFVVGCIIVFGGFTIWKLVITFSSNVDKQQEAAKPQLTQGEKDTLTGATTDAIKEGIDTFYGGGTAGGVAGGMADALNK